MSGNGVQKSPTSTANIFISKLLLLPSSKLPISS